MRRLWTFAKRVACSYLDSDCLIHAAGLTYFTILSLVPLLCSILVLAKACHVDRFARAQIDSQINAVISQVEEGQDNFLLEIVPIDDEARETRRAVAREFAEKARSVSNTLFERIDAFDVSAVGWIGFGFLLWSIVSSLSTVERSFNLIWNVPNARVLWRRCVLYLAVLVVLPVLLAIVMSLPILHAVKSVLVATMGSLWLTKWVSDGIIAVLDSTVLRVLFPLATSSLMFGFFYWLLPNCRVRWRTAWLGGMAVAVLFALWLRVCSVAQVGIARSSMLYGSFAFLPIVLAWIYVSWQIVLAGACLIRTLDAPRADVV